MMAGRASAEMTCRCCSFSSIGSSIGDDPLALRDERGEGVEERRLPGTGAAGDHDVQLAP